MSDREQELVRILRIFLFHDKEVSDDWIRQRSIYDALLPLLSVRPMSDRERAQECGAEAQMQGIIHRCARTDVHALHRCKRHLVGGCDFEWPSGERAAAEAGERGGE